MIAVMMVLAATVDLGEVLKTIVAGIGVVGFIAATAQFVRGSADKGTITSLKSSVDALETENELKDKSIAKLTQEVATMTQELQVWRNAVTAKEEITHLSANVAEHHVESTKLVHEMINLLRALMSEHAKTQAAVQQDQEMLKQESTEVKKLVARMHSELTEIRNVVKP